MTMLPGATYVLGAMISVGFLLLSCTVGLIIYWVLCVTNTESDGFISIPPPKKIVRASRGAAVLFTVLLFYGLTPIMSHCIRWALTLK